MRQPTPQEIEAMEAVRLACKRLVDAEAEFWPDYPPALEEPVNALYGAVTDLLQPEGEAEDWQAQNDLWLAADAVLVELDRGGAPEVPAERVEALRAALAATSIAARILETPGRGGTR
jgi:hypothetical protein